MAILSSTIADDQLDHVVTSTRPSEVWTILHSINEQTSSACKLELLHEFFTYAYQEGDTMVSHVTKVKNIAAKLEVVKEKQSEAAIVSRIISTLPERFVSAWKMQKEENRNLVDLTNRLNEEEIMHTQREKTEAFTASKTRLAHKKTNRQTNENKGKCFKCGSTEHFKRDCPKVRKDKGQAYKKEKHKQSTKDEPEASA